MSKNKEQKLDPRVVRTRQLLRESLVVLIPEKSFDAITVKDITDQATLNRATFYLHYRDKNDLLMDLLEYFIAHMALPQEADLDSLSPDDALPNIIQILEHVAEFSGFYRVMLGEGGVPAFAARLRDSIEEVGLPWLSLLQPDKEHVIVPLEIAINFLGWAYLGAIAWWLENNMPHSPEYMAKQLLRLSVLGIHRSMGLTTPELSHDF